MKVTKKLGDILINAGVVTEEQVVNALKEQKISRKRLGEVIIELGYATELDVLNALSEQFGLPVINLENFKIEPELLKLIPAAVAKSHVLIPISLAGKNLTLAVADPLDIFIVDQIQRKTKYNIEIVLASKSQILGAIKQYYGDTGEFSELIGEISDTSSGSKVSTFEKIQKGVEVEDSNEENPIIKFANLIIKQAVDERVSDIHIEPEADNLRLRYRIDGVLQEIVKVPQHIKPALVSRFKIMAGMDIAEKRLPQDGRIQVNMKGKEYDLRVNTLPTVWGEKVVMRILDRSSTLLGLEKLGFLPGDLKKFRKLIREPNGIILLTGPTGSGKTTTLYAALNEIKSPKINITTIENPVEYRIPLLNQVQVKSEIGLDFANTLRAILRQDPDVIMIGEIRDIETADIAIEAALTGHLVFSTLHTNDAPSTVVRLLEMGIKPYLINPTILCVVAQRLVRRLCKHCREEYQPDERILNELGNTDLSGKKFYRGKGCIQCNQSGYRGRLGVHEIMILNDDLRELIVEKPSITRLRKVARQNGMITLRQNALLKALSGLTTLEEVLRVTKAE